MASTTSRKPTRNNPAQRGTKRPAATRQQANKSQRRNTSTAAPTSASRSRKNPSKTAPPAASVAAAQKLLRTVERREQTLRQALKQHTKALKKLKKDAADHRGAVKDLQAQVRKVKKQRQSVAADL